MTEKSYQKMIENIRKRTYGETVIRKANVCFTGIIYVAYILVVMYLLVSFHRDVLRVILVPGISFIGLTFIRNKIDAPRPYTIYDFEPIIKKEKQGNSFPSRHVFSAFVIAATFLYIDIRLGIGAMIISIVIAVLRVLGGVHFPKDVIVGAIAGIVCGILGSNLFI